MTVGWVLTHHLRAANARWVHDDGSRPILRLLLFYDADLGKSLSLAVGSLDDPSGVKPDDHYGIESRLPWADCGPDRVTLGQRT